MANIDSIVQELSGVVANDHLMRKYYCVVENNQANIALTLTALDTSRRHLSTLVVLLIDVSYSMSEPIGEDKLSLLERIKISAQLLIQMISTHDYLSIVSFNSEAKTILQATQMTTDGKEAAKTALSMLIPSGGTNLEKGFEMSFQKIKTYQNRGKRTYSTILLFTDGQANEGRQDAASLIELYKCQEKEINAKQSIPLSVFTSGNFNPHVLNELADKLGSEPLYWLDSGSFEQDMIIPVFVRERKNISDVQIKVKPKNETYFMQDSTFNENLSSSELSYFFHSIPPEIPKTIPLPTLVIPASAKGNIMEISLTFSNRLETVQVTDIIVLSECSMYDSKIRGKSLKIEHAEKQFLNGISAYTVLNNNATPNDSWTEAKRAIVKIAEIRCKDASEKLLHAALSERLGKEEGVLQMITDMFRSKPSYEDIESHTFDDIDAASKRVRLCVSQDIDAINRFDHYVCNLKNCLITLPSISNALRLAAVKSAIKREMPTCSAVYGHENKQLFRPKVMEQKLAALKKIVVGIKNEANGDSFSKISSELSSKENEINQKIAEITSRAQERQIRKNLHVFSNKYFMLSENVENKDDLRSKIEDLGGEIIENAVNLKGCKAFLVCPDQEERSALSMKAQIEKIPRVLTSYVDECFGKERLLDHRDFLAPDPILIVEDIIEAFEYVVS